MRGENWTGQTVLPSEFRDASWFDDDVFAVLRDHDVALCVTDSEALDVPDVVTAGFAYYRLRRSDYSDAEVDGSGTRARKHLAWTLGIGLFLAIVDELYQGFVPGRERDILDVLADALGLLAGWYYSREDEAIGDSHRAPGHS